MGKGLKTSVAEALAETEAETPEVEPVYVSAEAMHALNRYMREWSGWPRTAVINGVPHVSPWAETDYQTGRFTFKIDDLVLNPNRVLLTVTPFRLKQEAVLTGAMLHEAGHARYSRWRPRKVADIQSFFEHGHSDGSAVTMPEYKLAVLCEEPRVEAMVARESQRIGATGLTWTMRASAAKLVPFTSLSNHHDQQVMDMITSWVIRAGRRIALKAATGLEHPRWVLDFNSLLQQTIAHHIEATTSDPNIDPYMVGREVIEKLKAMMCWDGASLLDDAPAHTAPFMVDTARDILAMLFPETDPEDMPSPQDTGCGDANPESDSESGTGGEGDESGEDGEGNTEPEDEGSGDDPGAGDSGEDEDGEPDEGEADADESEGDESEGDESEGDESDDTDGATDSTTGAGSEADEAETDALAKALAALEARAETEATDEIETGASGGVVDATDDGEGDDTEDADSAGGAGVGVGNGRWRKPTPDERDVQRRAERFMRDLIDATEGSTRTLTDTPSSTVDGGALAAWKAGGAVRAPHFFVRTRRSVEPSPPIQIAVLADVSLSMAPLQKPTALLSWAASAAALDLRNFAGRGVQVESCLIHWGSEARVIGANGKMLPGIREFPCNEGTSALDEAHDLVEQQIPGFFDATDRPVNRLLVTFTDWMLERTCAQRVEPQVVRALENGVNMLSVVPSDWNQNSVWAAYGDIMRAAKVKRGRTAVLKYNKMFPEQVWDHASMLLKGETPPPFAGF